MMNNNAIVILFLCISDIPQYCHNEVFEAECQKDNVIIMEKAYYGRMSKGRCVKTDFGFVGCRTDVISLATARCSGRSTCSIGVPDAMFDNTRPCNDDLKSYFEADYRCIPGNYRVTSIAAMTVRFQRTTSYERCLHDFRAYKHVPYTD